ncbi:unnamed protein product [Arctia plantaginis]|uniref:Uncharacterized protein n=1 Tax=Arctia plantaginis TaxID=874455 RepID=A0A8S0ZRS4_ARCPL|nr:unnamed protein product [Arctia plantaginis]
MAEDSKKSRVSMALGKSKSVLGEKSHSGQIGDKTSSAFTKFTSRVRVRKSSFGYGGIPGIGRVAERSSMLAPEFKRPPLIYLNTYQLDPLKRFHPPSVIKAAGELLDELFTDHKYHPQESPTVALRIAGELMKAVKAMAFNRYRIISVVTIAQKRAQSYNNAISFLWDHERDGSINVNRDTSTAFIQVTVFAVYLD